jgi:molybdopterin converting factor small subunit
VGWAGFFHIIPTTHLSDQLDFSWLLGYNNAMPVIKIPNPLRSYVNGQAEVSVQGTTAGAALQDMLAQFPAFRPHLCKEDGSLRAFVNLYLGRSNIRDLQGLDTLLKSDDILNLVPAIAGG